MFERYTEKARRVIFYARYEATMFGSATIEPEHLMLGLAREDEGLISRFVPEPGAIEELRRRSEEKIGVRAKLATSLELPLGRETKLVLAFAYEESEILSHWHIGTEHLLLGLLRAKGSLVERVLREKGLDLIKARAMVKREQEDAKVPAEVTSRAAGDPHEASHPTSTSMTIEHIGIATPRLDDALGFWRDVLGLAVVHVEEVAEQGVRVAMLPLGEPRIELLEPTGPASPVAKFLEKRGAGVHHVAVRVPDVRVALARLKEGGARLIDETPRVGAGGCLVAFVHPSSAGGVLLELVEHASGQVSSELERQ